MKNLLLLGFLFLSACAHSIHQVHTSDFARGVSIANAKIVKAQSEQFVVLGFTGNTDYVDQAYNGLMQACPGGQITGITTQISTSLGFLSWTNKALLQGFCLNPS